ncbi:MULTISPECIES: hypothetical protein [Lactiplantibacillus]|jgi:hypothetical protein|uniref:hypothetical protein n=1 Tax=Lactiplantibacillus TaxID=2767842 RepID=UPI001D0619F4|nr:MULTISPECIES: hypothetical protein [Lactiplantibacillus]MCB7149208.1 hypothetical protein [Lactiplantibacillus plantarum]MCB7169223.1 hypothetical protein [Lactiplantibacillus plantarum]MCJ8186186.1 hypothetical protein [Lactiplantibacillus pentosus]
MAKPNWTPRLADVLKHKTVEMGMHSDRTGNDYKADVIPELRVRSTGNVEELDDGFYRYSIVDNKAGLEYEIKVQKKIEVKFGSPIEFKNVRGGATTRGGWYSADDVDLLQLKNA